MISTYDKVSGLKIELAKSQKDKMTQTDQNNLVSN